MRCAALRCGVSYMQQRRLANVSEAACLNCTVSQFLIAFFFLF